VGPSTVGPLRRLTVRGFLCRPRRLVGPILVAQGGELVRQVVEAAPAPRHDPTQVSADAGPADWHLFTIDVEGAAFHDYALALSHLPLMDGG
jgi:hypothetical protein